MKFSIECGVLRSTPLVLSMTLQVRLSAILFHPVRITISQKHIFLNRYSTGHLLLIWLSFYLRPMGALSTFQLKLFGGFTEMKPSRFIQWLPHFDLKWPAICHFYTKIDREIIKDPCLLFIYISNYVYRLWFYCIIICTGIARARISTQWIIRKWAKNSKNEWNIIKMPRSIVGVFIVFALLRSSKM